LRNHGVSHEVLSNSAFLREGNGLSDFLNSGRIVIGVHNGYGMVVLTEIYKPLINKKA
jgi:UDP-glucose 6-dehydrogenase